MNLSKTSYKVALCGILTALSVVLMMVSGFLGVLTYAAPMLAGGVLIVPVKEYGSRTALTMYAAVSLLSLVLVADKEAALIYLLLFGLYPIVQPYVNRMTHRHPRRLVKAALFNAAAVLSVLLAQVIFAIPIVENSRLPALVLVAGYLVFGNICFVMYDHALMQFYTLYDVKVRVMLHKLLKR